MVTPQAHITTGDAQTRSLGERLARHLRAGDVVALIGQLGSGKTCLTQGIGRGLGVASPITSPTFTLLHQYRGRLPLYHFDLYRINQAAELDDFGFEEIIDGDGVCVIEWAEKCLDRLPARRICVRLQVTDPDRRYITIDRPGP